MLPWPIPALIRFYKSNPDFSAANAAHQRNAHVMAASSQKELRKTNEPFGRSRIFYRGMCAGWELNPVPLSRIKNNGSREPRTLRTYQRHRTNRNNMLMTLALFVVLRSVTIMVINDYLWEGTGAGPGVEPGTRGTPERHQDAVFPRNKKYLSIRRCKGFHSAPRSGVSHAGFALGTPKREDRLRQGGVRHGPVGDPRSPPWRGGAAPPAAGPKGRDPPQPRRAARGSEEPLARAPKIHLDGHGF